MAGVLTGCVGSLSFMARSEAGSHSQKKSSRQSKPPLGSDKKYLKCRNNICDYRRWVETGSNSKVLRLMLSMTGEAMVLVLSWILASSGCSQSVSTSQWLSRNTRVSPVAA